MRRAERRLEAVPKQWQNDIACLHGHDSSLGAAIGHLSNHCFRPQLAPDAPAPTTVWRRLKRWGEVGIWERIWRAALAVLDGHGKLDWSMAFLDGSFAPAKRATVLIVKQVGPVAMVSGRVPPRARW